MIYSIFLGNFNCLIYYTNGKLLFKQIITNNNKQMNKEQRKEYQKKYRLEHQEVIKERKKIYRAANKQKISDYNKKHGNARVVCECGKTMNRSSLTNHRKRNAHIRLLKEKEETMKTNVTRSKIARSALLSLLSLLLLSGSVAFSNVPGNLQRPNLPLGMAVQFDDIANEDRRTLLDYLEKRRAQLEV